MSFLPRLGPEPLQLDLVVAFSGDRDLVLKAGPEWADFKPALGIGLATAPAKPQAAGPEHPEGGDFDFGLADRASGDVNAHSPDRKDSRGRHHQPNRPRSIGRAELGHAAHRSVSPGTQGQGFFGKQSSNRELTVHVSSLDRNVTDSLTSHPT